MPSPPGAAPAPPLPRAQRVAPDAHRIRALERLDRRVARVRHRGVHTVHARTPVRPPALAAADRLVVHPARHRRASTLFIVPCDAPPTAIGRGLRERAEAHVGDALAHLDVARADRDRASAPRRCDPRGASTRTGRSTPPFAGRSGSTTDRNANTTALTVTASTALTEPARCASVPAKSKVIVSAGDGDLHADARRAAARRARRSSRARRRSGTRRRAGRAIAARRPALAVVDDLGEHSRRAAASGRSRSRATPSRFAPSCASRSPRRSSGVRDAATTSASTPAVQRTGGMRRPSWKISVASGGNDPGAIPPTSAWWARFAAHPSNVPSSANAGATNVMSFRWVPPANGSFTTIWSPGSSAVAARVDRGPHGRRHRTEMHRDVLGLREQRAVGREHRARAVGALFDVRAVRGAAQHRAHLVGHAREPRDPHLQRRRIHHRSSLRSHDPGAELARLGAPTGGYPHRAVGFGDDRGPDDPARGRPSGRSVMRSGAAIDARARTAITSIGRARRGRGRCGARARPGTSSGDADGQLVALTDVTAVDRGLDDARPRRPAHALRRSTRASASASDPPVKLCTTSRASGAHSSPTAETHPGTRRNHHRRACRARPAIAHACSGPAPPNATSASVARVDARARP